MQEDKIICNLDVDSIKKLGKATLETIPIKDLKDDTGSELISADDMIFEIPGLDYTPKEKPELSNVSKELKMTNEEAILMLMHLQEPEPWEPEISEKAYDALEIAIEAVKRITPKRPVLVNKHDEFDGNYYLTCPVCGSVLFERVTDECGSRPYAWSHTYMCSDCGQALDTVDESFSKTALEIVREESSK